MRFGVLFILAALLFVSLAEPILATGLGGSSPYWGKNTLEAYCLNNGGSPSGGYCYFPDGGYCDLRSFYNGTCPGRAYYEQAIWMNEAYNFLYGDEVYSLGTTPYSAYGNPYYNNYYYNYWPTYGGGYGWL